MKLNWVIGLLALISVSRGYGSTYYVTVAGLGGEPEYDQRFRAVALDLDKVFRASEGTHVYTLSGPQATRDKLAETLASISRQADREDELILTLIGHGSYDGFEYKFNLLGKDVSAKELAGMLDRIRVKRQLVVNATSASGGSIAALQRSGRAIITATKNGSEKNATVFARYWAEALQDPAADSNKSDSISALEAFTYAQKKVSDFYESNKRLATEHAVFEDTGVGEGVKLKDAAGRQGSLLETFTVIRIGAAQAAMKDPAKRELSAKKEALEERIDALKYRKAAMEPGDYKKQLTDALLQLALVQAELDR